MRLVGGMQANAREGDISFHAGLFGRLTSEVKATGDPARYVGYESSLGGEDHLRFFGIEVNEIEGVIPAGMVAWDLCDGTWTVSEPKGGRNVVTWREDITWKWLDRPEPGHGGMTGEFTARVPERWGSGKISGWRDFRVSANAYVRPKAAGCEDDVHLVDYDSSWPDQFDEIARRLRAILGGDLTLRVEHYGSTAIPGMPAKPVIDVLVEIPSFEEARKRAIPRLNLKSWEYWWYSHHMIFIRRREFMGRRTHHIHMAPRGHEIWSGLAFRDYLRTHPGEALRYAELKRELASRYREDREGYTIAKGAFVHEVTSKALRLP